MILFHPANRRTREIRLQDGLRRLAAPSSPLGAPLTKPNTMTNAASGKRIRAAVGVSLDVEQRTRHHFVSKLSRRAGVEVVSIETGTVVERSARGGDGLDA